MWFRRSMPTKTPVAPEEDPFARLKFIEVGEDNIEEYADFQRRVDGSSATATEVRAEIARPDVPLRAFLLRDPTGAVAAAASLTFPQVDHTTEAHARLCVDVPLRRFGVGTRLLAKIEEIAREAARTRLTGVFSFVEGSPSDSATLRFVDGNGFHTVQRMGIWKATLSNIAAGSAKVPGYHITLWVDECPPELLTARAALQEGVTHDQPSGEQDLAQVWDADRLAGWLTSLRDGGVHVVEAVALYEGEPVAFSTVFVNDTSSQASQRDTYVLADHRGHGLGAALKAAVAQEIGRQFAHVERVRSFVDETNAPMNAINRRLGFAQQGILFQVAKDL